MVQIMRPERQSVAQLEERTQQIGRELLGESRETGGLWKERLMEWALEDGRFKAELFRFVDVFPVLRTPAEVHGHLVEYLSQRGVTLPTGMGVALKAGGLLKGVLAKTVAGQI